MSDWAQIREKLAGAAHAAGEVLKSMHSNAVRAVDTKSDKSPVTPADLASHEFLSKLLPQIIPVPVLSEEGQQHSAPAVYWLVDPLDGTKDYIAGNGEYAVNITLMRDHTVEIAAIGVPMRNKVYLAKKGNGACIHTKGSRDVTICKVNPTQNPPLWVISRFFSEHLEARVTSAVQGIQTRTVGSALKYCLVASGEASLHIRRGRSHEWDVAAGELLVKEAGGSFIWLDGSAAHLYGLGEKTPGFVGGASVALVEQVRVALTQK